MTTTTTTTTQITPTAEQTAAAQNLIDEASRETHSGRLKLAERIALLLAQREDAGQRAVTRLLEAAHVQMAATGLPKPFVDVVRGVFAEHPYALSRIEDLEAMVRERAENESRLRLALDEAKAEVARLGGVFDGLCADCRACPCGLSYGEVEAALAEEGTSIDAEVAKINAKIESGEPSEEQKQAAAEWWRSPPTSEAPALALARFLAEREDLARKHEREIVGVHSLRRLLEQMLEDLNVRVWHDDIRAALGFATVRSGGGL
jgi:hypothetical protein